MASSNDAPLSASPTAEDDLIVKPEASTLLTPTPQVPLEAIAEDARVSVEDESRMASKTSSPKAATPKIARKVSSPKSAAPPKISRKESSPLMRTPTIRAVSLPKVVVGNGAFNGVSEDV